MAFDAQTQADIIETLDDAWIDEGWDAWDLLDGLFVIDDALQYMDDHESL